MNYLKVMGSTHLSSFECSKTQALGSAGHLDSLMEDRKSSSAVGS